MGRSEENASSPSTDGKENSTLRTNVELESLGCKSESLTWDCKNTINNYSSGCGGNRSKYTS